MSRALRTAILRRPLHRSMLSHPRRSLLLPSSTRAASTTSHDSEPDNENYYTNETFASKPLLITAGVIVGFYALYKVSLENAPAFANDPANLARPGSTDLIEEAEDERRPWITRYLAYHFAPQTEMYKERNNQGFDTLIQSAEDRLLVNTAQPPVLLRRRSWAVFDDTSPFNKEVGTDVDISHLRIKTYADDRKLPEKEGGDEKEGDDGDSDD